MLKTMINIKLLILIQIITLTITPLSAQAKNNEDLKEVQQQLICAASSMASYNDELGFLVRGMLTRHGFKIDSITDETNKAKAKALIAHRKSDNMKILAISGTDEIKDAEVDMRLKMKPLNINNKNKSSTFTFKQPDEIANDPELMANTVMVHSGFQDYADVMLQNETIQNLILELRTNRNKQLYMTGHSLGGAVAIVLAVKMVELGIDPHQLQVMTFGAPAVGNKKLSKDYGDKINIKRVTVSGDPIKKSLQVLGYVHIGNEIKYKPAMTVEHFPHMMAIYLDCAIRNYYDEKGFDKPDKLSSDEIEHIKSDKSDTVKAIYEKIYVAPMQVMKKSFIDKDFKYVKAALRDELMRQMPFAVYDEKVIEINEMDNLAEFDDDISAALKSARESNCKYILVQYLQAKKIQKDYEGNYRVSLEEIIYDLSGFLKSMQISSVTTKELTIMEAAIFAQENLSFERLLTN